nr:hypothetical protein [Lachnospiraceae bacterium]
MRRKNRTRHFLATLLTLLLSTGEILGSGFSVRAAGDTEAESVEAQVAEEDDAAAGEEDCAEEADRSGESAEAAEENAEYADDEAAPEEAYESEDAVSEADEPEDEVITEEEPDGADIPVEKTLENTMLGTWDMASPVVPASDQDPWKGSFVYYGKYEGKVLKYRVLDRGGCDF